MAPLALRGIVTLRRRLSRALLWASGLALLAPWCMTAIGRPLGWLWLKPYATGALGHSLWLGPLLAVLAAVAAWPRTRRPASIHVGDTEVTVDGDGRERHFARADIEGGMLLPSPAEPVVELYLRGGDVVRLAVADEAAGTKLLDALDIGPSERRVRVTVADPVRRAAVASVRAGVIALAWLIILGFSVDAWRSTFGTTLPHTVLGPWLALLVYTIAGVAWLRRPTEVVVGAEGVRVVTARTDRIIPYEAIEDVRVDGPRLEIRERGAGVTRIDSGLLLARGPGPKGEPAALLGLARRIREGIIGARSTASEGLAARLERGARSTAEWRGGLAQLFAAGSGYRTSSLARDVAEHVLDDGAAGIERRVGAALALAAAGGEESRTRIRIAAAKTTNDKLRIALQRIAEDQGDDDAEREIEQALAEAATDAEAHAAR